MSDSRIRCFEPRHATGVAEVARVLEWPSLSDPALVVNVFTAPGASAEVALVGDRVVGFAQALGDGNLQSHLSFLAVLPTYRRHGIARRLTKAVFDATETKRMDLITDEADEFYQSLTHRRMSGYRIYPFELVPPG